MVNADMLWPLYAIAEAISVIIAYITNPIVVLFADEYGNLPDCLRWWTTFDNCLDVRWMITENKVPKIFQYDYDKHYKYFPEDKGNGYVVAGHSRVVFSSVCLKLYVGRFAEIAVKRHEAVSCAYPQPPVVVFGYHPHVGVKFVLRV